MLEEIKKNYIRTASCIKNWEDISVNVLANAYIDNENDEKLRSAYFSAILLKKWKYIGKHYATSKASGFSIEDCYDMVVHGIQYALENRKWRDPNNKLYKDKCAPDKVLNRCIASSRDIQYYNSNTQKRRANFGKTSLDLIEENVKDCTTIIGDDNQAIDDTQASLNVDLLIERLMSKNKILEALIINDIVAGDCFATTTRTKKMIYEDEEQTYKAYSKVFKLPKLVNNLYEYSEKELRTICDTYCISKEKEDSLITLFKKTSKSKFDKVIKTTLLSMAEDKTIRNHLCF